MQQPQSNSSKDMKEFLLWCSKNNQTKTWNNWRDLSPDIVIELGGVSLRYVDLSDANLSDANLSNADLSNADLSNANLIDANLNKANLINANLNRACLINADLRNTNLSDADLTNASIDGIILDGKNVRLFDQQYLIPNVDKAKISSKLKQLEVKYKELQKTTGQSKEENKEIKFEKDKVEHEKKALQEELERINAEKNKETKNINEIIGYLGKIPEEISSEQTYSKERRGRFTLFATLMFSGGVIIAIGFVANIVFGNYLNLPTISNTGQYLAYALSVAFPMVLSFLFQRQANIKSREIDKINEKSIIIQQVENALNAYNVLLSGNRLEDKTIGSIDRVLDKLFENGHEQNINTDTKEPKVSMGDLHKFIKTMSHVAKH